MSSKKKASPPPKQASPPASSAVRKQARTQAVKRRRADSDDEIPSFGHHESENEHESSESEADEAPAARKQRASSKAELAALQWNAPRDDPGPVSGCPPVTRQRQRLTLHEDQLRPGATDELGVWQAFFDNELLDLLIVKTNIRLLERAEPKLTVNQFYIWLALLLTMGIRKLPSTKDYWRTDSFGKLCFMLPPFCPHVCYVCSDGHVQLLGVYE